MKKGAKHLLNSTLKFLVAVLLIYWLVQSGRFDLESVQKSLSPEYLAIFLFLVFLNLSFNTIRWQEILKAFEVRFSFLEAFRLGLIGIFFNYAMPGGVGGDLVKGYYTVKKNPQQKTAAATSVLLDRLIGLASMVSLALISLLLQYELIFENISLKILLVSLSGVFLAFVLLFLVGTSSRWITFIKNQKLIQKFNFKGIPFRVLDSFHIVAKDRSLLLKTFVLSALSQTCMIVLVFILAKSVFQLDISWQIVYFAVPLTMIVTALPIAPAGIGVGQVAMYSFFELMKVSQPEIGATAITVIQIMLFAWGLLGSYYYLRMDVPATVEKTGA